MGRRRKHLGHLPQGLRYQHGAYFFVVRSEGSQKWLRLSSNYNEALHKYADLVGHPELKTLTISDAISHYLLIKKDELKADTIAGYQQSARRLGPVFGHMALDELRREHVYRYLITRKNVAANRDKALLSTVYTHFQNIGSCRGANPCVGLRYRNPERPRRRYITDDEFAKLIAALPKKLSLMARWSYVTGMRESDMLALSLGAASEAGVTYIPGKSRKTKEAVPILITWTDELRDIWRAAAGVRIGAQPLFATARGGHYSRDSFQSLWQRWRKKSGIEDLRWHDIRRKSGSDSENDAAATDLLNHANNTITRKHYRAKPRVVKPLR